MKVILLGDRLTCAGYRLAGIDARVVEAADVETTFAAARAAADLVMITANLSSALREDRLHAAIRDAVPPVQVVPDLHAPENAPDLRSRIMRALGVGE